MLAYLPNYPLTARHSTVGPYLAAAAALVLILLVVGSQRRSLPAAPGLVLVILGGALVVSSVLAPAATITYVNESSGKSYPFTPNLFQLHWAYGFAGIPDFIDNYRVQLAWSVFVLAAIGLLGFLALGRRAGPIVTMLTGMPTAAVALVLRLSIQSSHFAEDAHTPGQAGAGSLLMLAGGALMIGGAAVELRLSKRTKCSASTFREISSQTPERAVPPE